MPPSSRHGAHGEVIRPTGRKVDLPMATIGHWKDGVMIEEHPCRVDRTRYRRPGVER